VHGPTLAKTSADLSAKDAQTKENVELHNKNTIATSQINTSLINHHSNVYNINKLVGNTIGMMEPQMSLGDLLNH